MRLKKKAGDIRGWGKGWFRQRVPRGGSQAGAREPRYLTTWLLAGPDIHLGLLEVGMRGQG